MVQRRVEYVHNNNLLIMSKAAIYLYRLAKEKPLERYKSRISGSLRQHSDSLGNNLAIKKEDMTVSYLL